MANAIKPTKYKIENFSRDDAHQIYVTAINNLSIELGNSNTVTTNIVSSDLIESGANSFSAYPNPFSITITTENLNQSLS